MGLSEALGFFDAFALLDLARLALFVKRLFAHFFLRLIEILRPLLGARHGFTSVVRRVL